MTSLIFNKGAAHRLGLSGDIDALGSNPTAPVVLCGAVFIFVARAALDCLIGISNVRLSHTF
jgi:hypothetical protein